MFLVHQLNNANKVFQTLAMFPWDKHSLKKLWPTAKPQWRAEIISECSDAVAVGADLSLYIFFTRQHQTPICVSLPAVGPDEWQCQILTFKTSFLRF